MSNGLQNSWGGSAGFEGLPEAEAGRPVEGVGDAVVDALEHPLPVHLGGLGVGVQGSPHQVGGEADVGVFGLVAHFPGVDGLESEAFYVVEAEPGGVVALEGDGGQAVCVSGGVFDSVHEGLAVSVAGGPLEDPEAVHGPGVLAFDWVWGCLCGGVFGHAHGVSVDEEDVSPEAFGGCLC